MNPDFDHPDLFPFLPHGVWFFFRYHDFSRCPYTSGRLISPSAPRATWLVWRKYSLNWFGKSIWHSSGNETRAGDYWGLFRKVPSFQESLSFLDVVWSRGDAWSFFNHLEISLWVKLTLRKTEKGKKSLDSCISVDPPNQPTLKPVLPLSFLLTGSNKWPIIETSLMHNFCYLHPKVSWPMSAHWDTTCKSLVTVNPGTPVEAQQTVSSYHWCHHNHYHYY